MRKTALMLLPLLTCLCCSLTCAALGSQPWFDIQKNYGYGAGSGSGEVPGGGDCANAGVIFADNPFHGWPLDYRPGDWSIVTFYFCAHYADGSPHWGMDFGAPSGEAQALNTCERGRVLQANDCDGESPCWNYGMGRFVQVQAQVRVPDYDQCVADHGGDDQADACWADSGWRATWMHLESVGVSVGQIVRYGQPLGRTDNSGNSTGPHLHYQINNASGAVDPAPTLNR
jgi:murein DD-endopeptidase MepM/ murein hydrolase activator NlpD